MAVDRVSRVVTLDREGDVIMVDYSARTPVFGGRSRKRKSDWQGEGTRTDYGDIGTMRASQQVQYRLADHGRCARGGEACPCTWQHKIPPSTPDGHGLDSDGDGVLGEERRARVTGSTHQHHHPPQEEENIQVCRMEEVPGEERRARAPGSTQHPQHHQDDEGDGVKYCLNICNIVLPSYIHIKYKAG